MTLFTYITFDNKYFHQLRIRNIKHRICIGYGNISISQKEKAGALLSKEEFSTLKFYLSEYKHANIAIKDLVRALRKMFDCEEKESLFTEIREVVNEKDLMEFDRIVYEKGKMFERVIQSQTRRNVSSSMQSLQGKQNIRNKKFASKTPLDKFKRLHYSLSSDNVLLARQHGGSQPVLNTRHLNTALNTSLPATQTLLSPLDRRPCGPYLEREARKERGFHNSLGNIVSEHSNSYKASSKSCEFLLDSISKQAGAKLCQALNPSHTHFRRFSALNTYLGACDIL